MTRSRGRRPLKLLLVLAIIVSSLAISGGAALAQGNSGAVYTLTNNAAGNEVAVFSRMADGSLTRTASVSTGGLGSGDGLGSQGAIVLSQNNKWLLAVNAGSNELSVLQVQGQDLHLTDVVPSGGMRPISVTIHGNIIYVLNDGGGIAAGNITGFWMNPQGELAMIPGSTQPLSADAVGPAQVQFTPHGNQLVVTEKATNQILTYAVDRHGLAGTPVVNQSEGMTPFGFDFTKRGDLIVSEAFGGAENASAVSSYQVNSGGGLHTRSASVGTHQTAACWVVVTNNGKFAYTTNTGS
ncbi:MAG TPA: beta-propeller fold lactonase family protein, partial [Chloroflexota bacterium]|nr:beta-propeller fold lactonase family protein [Chloroflexota bacterium]